MIRFIMAGILCTATGASATLRTSATLDHREPCRDRPVLSGPEITLQSTSGFFLVHYTNAGSDAVTAEYVDSAAALADSALSSIVSTLGFPDPPSDLGNGGSPLYDIYILSLGASVSGYTQVDFYTSGFYEDIAAASYIALASGLTSDELAASAAHHVMHASVYGYSASEPGAWVIQTGGWVETHVFPEADVWQTLTANYLINCHSYLFDSDGFTEHGALLWPKFLDEYSGDTDIVRRIWYRCAMTEGANTVGASDSEIQSSLGIALEFAYQIFTSWNYISGIRDDGLHYDEGNHVTGSVPLLASHSVYPVSGTSGILTAPHGLGCNYIEFLPEDDSPLHITVSGETGSGEWGGAVVSETAEGAYVFEPLAISSETGFGDTLITGFSDLARVILIVHNLKRWADPPGVFSYTADQTSTPSVPMNLRAFRQSDSVLLSWDASTDPNGDLAGYHVYRSETPHEDTTEMVRIGDTVSDEDLITPGIQWTDENYLGADVIGDIEHNYFYRISAVDLQNNESPGSNGAGEIDYELDDGP